MAGEIHKTSLRDTLIESVGAFLEEEGFKKDEVLIEGVVLLINLISDYYEEGRHLYPEVFITHDLDGLGLYPSRSLVINSIAFDTAQVPGGRAENGNEEGYEKVGKGNRWDVNVFKRVLKECAPLAIDGWVIFIELGEECVRFGVFSSEITETTLSLYRQTVQGDLLPVESTFAYIRSIGQKVVELRGKRSRINIHLNLDREIDVTDNKVERLALLITSGCGEEIKDKLGVYMEKVLDGALKAGHGNLIGVVEDNEEKIEEVKSVLHDGSYLEKPIDMASLVMDAESEKSDGTTVALRAFASLMSSMINHDGITLMSDTGKLLGFHLFVKAQQRNTSLVGGARSRAFEAMKELGLKACF